MSKRSASHLGSHPSYSVAIAAALALSLSSACATLETRTTYEHKVVGVTKKLHSKAAADRWSLQAECVGPAIAVKATVHRPCTYANVQRVQTLAVKTTVRKGKSAPESAGDSALYAVLFGLAGAGLIVWDASGSLAKSDCTSEEDKAAGKPPKSCAGIGYAGGTLFTLGSLLFLGEAVGQASTGVKRTVTDERDVPGKLEEAKCSADDALPEAVEVLWPDGLRAKVPIRFATMGPLLRTLWGEATVALPPAERMAGWSGEGAIQVKLPSASAQLPVAACEVAVLAIEREEAARRQRDAAEAAERQAGVQAEEQQLARRRAEQERERQRLASEQAQADAQRAEAQQAQDEMPAVAEESSWVDVWDPRRGNIVSASQNDDGGWEVLTDDGAVWVSRDAGLTWTRRSVGSAISFRTEVQSVRAVVQVSILGGTRVEVRRGEEVVLRAELPAAIRGVAIRGADFVESRGGVRLVLLASDAWALDDAGAWRKADALGVSGIQQVFVRGVGGQVWVAVDQEGRVFRSTDAGARFTPIDSWPTDERVALMAGMQGRIPDLVVATRSGRLFASVDSGLTWRGLASRLPDDLGPLVQIALHPTLRGVFGVLGHNGLVWTFDNGQRLRRARNVRESAFADARGLRWMGSTAVVWGGRRTGVQRLATVSERVVMSDATATTDGTDGSTLHFRPNSAELSASSLVLLKPVVERMQAEPQLSARIEGHTDASGARDKNYELGLARAESVKRALLANHISPDRVTVLGFGPDRPVAPADAQGRSPKNRRVEILLLAP